MAKYTLDTPLDELFDAFTPEEYDPQNVSLAKTILKERIYCRRGNPVMLRHLLLRAEYIEKYPPVRSIEQKLETYESRSTLCNTPREFDELLAEIATEKPDAQLQSLEQKIHNLAAGNALMTAMEFYHVKKYTEAEKWIFFSYRYHITDSDIEKSMKTVLESLYIITRSPHLIALNKAVEEERYEDALSQICTLRKIDDRYGKRRVQSLATLTKKLVDSVFYNTVKEAEVAFYMDDEIAFTTHLDKIHQLSTSYTMVIPDRILELEEEVSDIESSVIH